MQSIGAAPAWSANTISKDQSNTLQGLFDLAINLHARIVAANDRMYKDLSAIGGHWPVNPTCQSDCAPPTDGIISAIQATLNEISRSVSNTEDIAARMSAI